MAFGGLSGVERPKLILKRQKQYMNRFEIDWRLLGSLSVLLFLRTNKPIRIDLLSIFLENFRGPWKNGFSS